MGALDVLTHCLFPLVVLFVGNTHLHAAVGVVALNYEIYFPSHNIT